MITIVELAPFLRHVDGILAPSEKEELLDALARRPELSTDIIRGTGGLRKLRWKAKGQGKSGGARIIYYFHSHTMPLFLITIYSKSDKASLTKTQKNQMKSLVAKLKSYGEDS